MLLLVGLAWRASAVDGTALCYDHGAPLTKTVHMYETKDDMSQEKCPLKTPCSDQIAIERGQGTAMWDAVWEWTTSTTGMSDTFRTH